MKTIRLTEIRKAVLPLPKFEREEHRARAIHADSTHNGPGWIVREYENVGVNTAFMSPRSPTRTILGAFGERRG